MPKTPQEYEFEFEITLKLDINSFGLTEAKARSKLTELVQDYFTDTTIEISKKEAKLIAKTKV